MSLTLIPGTKKQKRSYRKWASMHQRCRYKKNPNYRCYGGRGIRVCSRWSGRGGYENFIKDMGEPPKGMTLDRFPDNNGDYEPGNCRWATWKQQAENRNKGGAPVQPKSLRSQALAAGLPYHVVYFRITRLGWPRKKALSTPKEERRPAGSPPVPEWKKFEARVKAINQPVAGVLDL